jgi:hypothetical protein
MVEYLSVGAVLLYRASSYCSHASAVELECPVHKLASYLELAVVEEDHETLTMNGCILKHNMQ